MEDEYGPDEFVPKNGFIQKDDENYATQNSPRKRSRNLPLVPCTIRQILSAQQITLEDDDFLIDGQLVNQVSIVALIINSSPQPNHYNYQIDDATGVLDVRIWIDNEPPYYVQSQSSEWTSGRYVRVMGNIKAFGVRRTLIAVRLNIVEDPNEITYHHLECLYIHMKNTVLNIPQSLPPPVAVQQQQQHQQTLPNNRSGSTYHPPQSGGRAGNQPQHQQQQQQHQYQHQQQHQQHPPPQQYQQQQQHQQQQHQSSVSSYSPQKKMATTQSHLQQQPQLQQPKKRINSIQQAIVDTIKLGNKNNGMSIKDCAKNLKMKGTPMTEQDLCKTIKFLCDEGFLYSTIDEQHYAPTGAS